MFRGWRRSRAVRVALRSAGLLLQSRPFALTDRSLPLTGVRVLELAQIVADPSAAR
jgi:hypothetical protein